MKHGVDSKKVSWCFQKKIYVTSKHDSSKDLIFLNLDPLQNNEKLLNLYCRPVVKLSNTVKANRNRKYV